MLKITQNRMTAPRKTCPASPYRFFVLANYPEKRLL